MTAIFGFVGLWGKALLGTMIGRLVAAGLACLVAWKINNVIVARKAVNKHVERSDRTAKRIGKNARARHSRIDRNTAAKRLWREFGL
jgi:hypothetical protein